MGIFDDIMAQAHSDVGKVVDVLNEVKKRALSKCSACADTGVVMTSRGEVRCHCAAGRIVDEKKRLPR